MVGQSAVFIRVRTGRQSRRPGLGRRARTGGRLEGMPHRGQESTDGTGGGELTVPMAWLYAEYIADELLRTGDLMPPTSFEFRAGRDALALTIFLSDTDGELSGIRVVSQLETWLSLTAYDQPWQDWVGERMAELAAETAKADTPS